MRRPVIAVSLLALALLVSACASSNAPGWTYAPPTPSPTAGPSSSAGASGAPSAGASAAPSAEASSAASAGASAPASGGAGGGGQVVDITAQNVDWTTKDVTAPANAAFTIHFDNQDASIPHNIVIKDGSGMAMFTGDLVTGVATKDYAVPALPAGTYTFVCQVHTNMIGNLTVGP